MIEWRSTTWGDEITLEYGKALRGYAEAPGPVRVFGTNGPVGWTNESLADGPGVILGRKGAYRGVHYSPDPFFVIDTAYYVRPKTDLEMRWLYYAIIYYRLGEIDDGSPIPSTTRAAVYPRELKVPPPAEQRAIVGVLGALDEKIEQNRRAARALEQLAQAIFRAWFIDFEPVKAKTEGATSFPSMPQEVFDALPTRFTYSEIGPVPEGWEVGSLGDISNEIRDGAKPDEIDSDTPYIGLEHMPKRCIALSEWEPVSKVTSNKSRFRVGQILFGKLRPYFHKVGVAPIDGVCSTDIVVVEPRSPLYFGMTLGLVSSDTFIAYTNACSTGTKMPRTKWADMKRHWLAIPQDFIAEAFNTIMQPVAEKIVVDTHESRKLAEMRDYLLPKLLGGSVRFSDATNVPEDAAP